MELNNILALKDAGVDLDGALRRFSGSAQLYERFLLRFPGDETFSQLTAALEAGETKDAFVSAHTLKGVTANLGLESLFTLTSEIVEFLRSGELEEARKRYPQLKEKYDIICGIITSKQ